MQTSWDCWQEVVNWLREVILYHIRPLSSWNAHFVAKILFFRLSPSSSTQKQSALILRNFKFWIAKNQRKNRLIKKETVYSAHSFQIPATQVGKRWILSLVAPLRSATRERIHLFPTFVTEIWKSWAERHFFLFYKNISFLLAINRHFSQRELLTSRLTGSSFTCMCCVHAFKYFPY